MYHRSKSMPARLAETWHAGRYLFICFIKLVSPYRYTLNMELQFGKYRGKNISEVYDLDLQYCKWLYPQEILIGEYPSIKEFLHEKFKDSDMTRIMTWGKYKNKRSIGWIKKNDQSYFDWLLNNEFVRNNCPALRKDLLDL